MRKSPTSAFTLIEMLTVLAIIVILAGMVLAVGGYVQKKGALSRTAGEIAMLQSACESYKTDNGSYPRDLSANSVTDAINPKVNTTPLDPTYVPASLFLYKQLSGDLTTNGAAGTPPDGIPDDGVPRYLKDFEPRILNTIKDPTTKQITQVLNLQDPFGFPYAYSTSAAADEQKYQQNLLRNPGSANTIARPTGSALHGFNAGSYDLWSTGGSNPTTPPSDPSVEWAKWVKNW